MERSAEGQKKSEADDQVVEGARLEAIVASVTKRHRNTRGAIGSTIYPRKIILDVTQ